jgi:mRNA interferase MazF
MVKRSPAAPERGDIVWIDFPKRRGHEQAGHRPAVILTSQAFNDRTSLMLCCPITTKVKGYPFEVPFAAERFRGAVLADQAYTFDWRARRAKPVGHIGEAALVRVGELVSILAQGA